MSGARRCRRSPHLEQKGEGLNERKGEGRVPKGKGERPELGGRCASEQTATDSRITVTHWRSWPSVCPLSGVKRTSRRLAFMSALDPSGHAAICAVANACTSTRPDIARPALGPDPGGYNGVSPRARNVN